MHRKAFVNKKAPSLDGAFEMVLLLNRLCSLKTVLAFLKQPVLKEHLAKQLVVRQLDVRQLSVRQPQVVR